MRVTDANEDWWIHTPLFDTVDVVGGSVTLPFLTYERTSTIQGDPGTQLEGYLNETITVPPQILRDSVSPSFNLPPAQQTPGSSTDRPTRRTAGSRSRARCSPAGRQAV